MASDLFAGVNVNCIGRLTRRAEDDLHQDFMYFWRKKRKTEENTNINENENEEIKDLKEQLRKKTIDLEGLKIQFKNLETFFDENNQSDIVNDNEIKQSKKL